MAQLLMKQAYIDLKFSDASNDLRMFYREIGESGAPALLLLHGGGVTGAENWEPFVKLNDYALSNNYRIVMPDHRGHGKTNNPRGTFMTYKELADDMAVFIQQMGLEHATIMGHSSGALTSLHLSIFYPQLVGRQILVGAHPNFAISEAHKSGLMNVYGTPDFRLPPTKWQLVRHDPKLAIWSWWLHSAVNWHKLIRSAWPMWAGELDLKRCDNDDNCDYQRVKCPTLVVWGQDEDFGSFDDHKLLADWIPNSQSVFVQRKPDGKAVTHIFVIEQPERLLEAVEPFLLDA